MRINCLKFVYHKSSLISKNFISSSLLVKVFAQPLGDLGSIPDSGTASNLKDIYDR